MDTVGFFNLVLGRVSLRLHLHTKGEGEALAPH